jgi:hypothetical protein
MRRAVTVVMTGKISIWGILLVTVTGLVPAKSGGLSDRFLRSLALITLGEYD